MKTHIVKPSGMSRSWYVLDAASTPLGRISTAAASLLLGKGKPSFSHHIDVGDFVIIINSDKLIATGSKLASKQYYSHSGYPGGLSSKTMGEAVEQDSTKVVTKAVRGMLPTNKLRAGRLARLKVYRDEQHNHQAQSPIAVWIGESLKR